MIKNYDLKCGNIKDDHLINMVNNGDIEYNESPCIVMNNLVSDHNDMVDQMGEAVLNDNKCKSTKTEPDGNYNWKYPNDAMINHTTTSLVNEVTATLLSKNSENILNHSLNNETTGATMLDEVKEYNVPVDYDTAFSGYYPDNEKDTEKAVHERKS